MRRPQDAKENMPSRAHPPRCHAVAAPVDRWPRREAAVVGERPAKDRGARAAAGGKKLDGLEHRVHAVLVTTSTTRLQTVRLGLAG